MTAAATTRSHQAAVDVALGALEERFAIEVARELRGLTRQAVKRFLAHQQTLTAAGEDPLRIPNAQELAERLLAEKLIASIILKYRAKAATTTVGAMAVDLGVSFEVRNRLLDNVIASQSGTLIVTAPQELIGEMMGSLQHSYDTGASIPKAAKALRETGYTHAKGYAERIARTELLRGVNSASLALVHATGAARYKTWMATMDKRTRPSHRTANSQTVPVKDAFSVGGSRLQYPGDPNGPADEVILCRCAIGYSDANDLIAGGSMATAEAVEEEVAVGAGWSGPIVQEGVDTGDGRRIAEGALAWRELPLTLMSQHNTPGEGGHADAQVAGRIDSLARNGENIDGAGVFDSGAWGAETERLVRDGMLKGISVDLAVEEYEVIPAEGVEDPDEALWLGTLNILKGTILGATIVPFPAFENATIALTASTRRQDLRKDGDTLVASFYLPFAPFPAGGDDEADPADAPDDAAEAVADIRAAVNGWPGLDGKVVVTIAGEDTTIAFPPESDEEPAEASAEVMAALATIREALRARVA